MKEETPAYPDPYRELQEAIAVISKYSEKKPPLEGTSEALKHFKKTIRQIGTLFLGKFLGSPSEATPVKEGELSKALETIKNHYLLIEKLKSGSDDDKKLARLALESIHSYNEHVEANAPSPKWSDKIARFLSKGELSTPLPSGEKKLQLPFTATTDIGKKRQTVDKLQHAFAKIAFVLDPPKEASTKEKISATEVDLFRMKAITLLRDHKLKVKRESVQKAPIILLSDDTDHEVISLFQTISPFPGETIELKGKFKRIPGHSERPIPLSDSFHLTTSSTQTGFPHPSQYYGWSLAVQLIPICPHRLEIMTHFSTLQERRKEIANALLPMGHLNEIGKELLKLKKETFDAHKEKLLPLHQTLYETILHLSLHGDFSTDPISRYFDLLASLPYAYDYLSDTNAIINEKFIKIPYNQLQEARLTAPAFLKNRNDTQRFLLEKIQEQEEKLKKESEEAVNDFERYTLDYILLMGKALANGIVPIILQELSENLSFAPPLLDEFSRLLQYSAYKQMMAFLDELNQELPAQEEMHLYLNNLLLEDIALFKNEESEEEEKISRLLNELEAYYNQRYYSRLAK